MKMGTIASPWRHEQMRFRGVVRLPLDSGPLDQSGNRRDAARTDFSIWRDCQAILLSSPDHDRRMLSGSASLGEFLIEGLALVALGLAANALLYLLLRSALRQRAQVHDGWRYLRPGAVAWIGLPLSLGFTGLLTYLYLFVGSARADAESQMLALFLLCVGFNLITIFVAYTTAVERVRWNETHIERRTLFFETRSMCWHELERFGEEPSGYLWIASYQGPKIRFSPYTNGVGELIAKAVRHLPTDLPPAEYAIADAALTRYATVTASRGSRR
jgi:hypothetical protein